MILLLEIAGWGVPEEYYPLVYLSVCALLIVTVFAIGFDAGRHHQIAKDKRKFKL